jgi:hypothetical protein
MTHAARVNPPRADPTGAERMRRRFCELSANRHRTMATKRPPARRPSAAPLDLADIRSQLRRAIAARDARRNRPDARLAIRVDWLQALIADEPKPKPSTDAPGDLATEPATDPAEATAADPPPKPRRRKAAEPQAAEPKAAT